jgi:hypothetical protein
MPRHSVKRICTCRNVLARLITQSIAAEEDGEDVQQFDHSRVQSCYHVHDQEKADAQHPFRRVRVHAIDTDCYPQDHEVHRCVY